MKLKDLFEFNAVGFGAPDANRPTPTTFRNMAPPLPDEMYTQFEDEEEVLPTVKTKSVTELAKKHGVSVKKIQKELRMGIKVEKEHTKKEKLAKEIALDHLNELPNYYTRLKRIEKH